MAEIPFKTKLPLVIAALSLLFSILIVPIQSFPYLGIAVTFACLSTLVFALKKNRTTKDIFAYIATLIFSFCIIWRANVLLTFLDIIAVFYLGTLLSISKKDKDTLGFIKLATSPFTFLLEAVKTKNMFPFAKSITRSIVNPKKNAVSLNSILITIALLVVIIPLLASANPFFEHLVNTLLSIFQIQSLFKFLFSGLLIPRAILFCIFLFILPRLASLVHSEKNVPTFSLALESIPLLLPKVAVSIVLAIFFITQAQLYFSDTETLKALDYTYSQYAREVFAQLTVVAGIIIGLLYNDRNRSKWSKLLAYLLIGEGLFLTFMAFKSVNDYSNQWGFTEKRLWGYTGVFWMLFVFALYLYSYTKRMKDTIFVQSVILLTVFTLFAVNVLNFDYLIYHNRKSITGQGIDHDYLVWLSADSHSYKEELLEADKAIQLTAQTGEGYNPAWTIARNIERLQRKYDKFDLRTLNISEYREYVDVKGIDIKSYSQKWESLYSSSSASPVQMY